MLFFVYLDVGMRVQLNNKDGIEKNRIRNSISKRDFMRKTRKCFEIIYIVGVILWFCICYKLI